ncbi:MAG: tetratricopeptide repeat protein [Chlorobi bacterium]|nr:tetratricopeptide repeat protein [Chlorobiota bacterium]
MNRIVNEIDKLEAGLRERPEDRQKQYELALCYLQHQRNSQALELLDRMLSDRNRDARAFYARAVAYLSMNDYRKAGCDFLRTIALDPDFLEAYRHLGFIQFTLGKEEAALKTVRTALEKEPDDAALYCVLGDILLDTGEPEKAREAFERALELDPLGAEPHCKLAMYYVSRGDMKGLKREYDILKDLDADMASQIETLFFQPL